MNNIQQYISIFLLAILMVACGKEEEIVTKGGTELEIAIQDQNQQPILAEIEVYLFSNQQAYEQSLVNEEATGYDYTVTSSSEGIALFSNIEPKQYYIYVSYTGAEGIVLNNYFSSKQLESPLIEEAITSIIVKLTPFNIGHIGFWTSENNLANLGINIWVKDELIGELSGVKNSSPSSLNDTQVLPVFYQTSGPVIWQARGKNGCYWSGELTLGKQDTTFVQLTACQAGKITFWAKPSVLTSHQKLTVVVNETEIIGELTSGQDIAPTNCDNPSNSQLVVEKPFGSYHYKVLSETKECVWINTFTINQECSNSVEIVNCEE